MAKAPPVGIADGDDVTQGSVNDPAWVSGSGTVISLLKKIAAGGGGGGGGAVTVADGADVAQGTTTDAAWSGSGAGTVIALLKKIAGGAATDVTDRAARLLGHVTVDNGVGSPIPVSDAGGTLSVDDGAGSLTVDGSVSVANFPATQPVSGTVATTGTDGSQATIGTTTDASTALTLVGLLKAIKAAVQGTLTVAGSLGRSWTLASGTDSVNVGNFPATQPVSGTVTADTELPAATALADAEANPIVPRAGSMGMLWNGASWDRVPGSVAAGLKVQGSVASGVADAGNPVKMGGKATFPALPTLVATGQRVDAYADLAGAQIVRKRPIPTYTAMYRLADATAGIRRLTVALTANTDKQVATIYHTAAATKRVQIKYVGFMFIDNTVASYNEIEIQPLSATTAPATGNPAITPGKADAADAAAEATCLALPTTAGSVLAVNSPVGIPFSQAQGVVTTDTNIRVNTITPLWDSRADGDGKDLIMRAGVAEGYAVVLRGSAATTVGFWVVIVFTEE